MRLWILRPLNEDDDRFTYDCAHGFVVRAETISEARELAQVAGGDERHYGVAKDPAWLDPSVTTCRELGPEGPAGIVMRDFHAG